MKKKLGCKTTKMSGFLNYCAVQAVRFGSRCYVAIQLQRLCPHLSAKQVDLVLTKFGEWQQGGYKNPEKLAAIIYLCLPPVLEDKKQEEAFLDGMVRLFRPGIAALFRSHSGATEGKALEAYGVSRDAAGKLGKNQDYVKGLLETLEQVKSPVCPISFVELQDTATKKLLDGVKVSVLFRNVAGRCYGQLFESWAIEHWLSLSQRDPVSNQPILGGSDRYLFALW